MTRRRVRATGALGIGLTAFALTAAGCRTADGTGPSSRRHSRASDIHGVRCLFDQKPWLNADTAGDRDPEGIRYRVFLDTGVGKGVLRDGTFYVEMYQVDRSPSGEIERTLVSDWRYPTSQFGTVAARILGKGYHLQLRWAKKDIAGHEIELITQYLDPDGNATRSATKRLRVPRYMP